MNNTTMNKMTQFTLHPHHSTFLKRDKDSITLSSPIPIQSREGTEIQFFLDGLIRPNLDTQIVFTPTPKVKATHLSWRLRGAKLTLQFKLDKTVYIMERLESLSLRPIEQFTLHQREPYEIATFSQLTVYSKRIIITVTTISEN